MRLEVRKNGLHIIPEDEQDEAYITDTLGLRGDGHFVPLRWVSAFGLPDSLAYLGTEGDVAKKAEVSL